MGDQQRRLSRPNIIDISRMKAQPLHEGIIGSRIDISRTPWLAEELPLTSDFAAAMAISRLGRQINEDNSSIGEYIANLMMEFRDARRATIWQMPKNTMRSGDESRLEHRISVVRDDKGFVMDESLDPKVDGRLVMAADTVFRSKKPVVFDYGMRTALEFDNLSRDDYGCATHPIVDHAGRQGSVAVLPVYYRDPGNPSRVVVFEGDLGLKGSSLDGLSSLFFTALGANNAAHQISFMLTHKIDVITILTKVQDFDEDFKLGLRQLISNQIGNMYLVFIDLDNFKGVNTKHGMRGGNAVLKKAAHAIKSSLRHDDTVSRWGGEEFAVILRDVASLDEAKVISERIRRNMEEMVTDFNDEQIKVTCSISITRIDDIASKLMLGSKRFDDVMLETIQAVAFDTADKGVREAKSSGKNRVCISQAKFTPVSLRI